MSARKKPCCNCDGSGEVSVSIPCPECKAVKSTGVITPFTSRRLLDEIGVLLSMLDDDIYTDAHEYQPRIGKLMGRITRTREAAAAARKELKL